MKLTFCVKARFGFETGFTPCEIGVGLPQAAPSCRRSPCGEVRCEAFAQRLAARVVSSGKDSEAAGVELSPPMFRDGNRFHTGRYTRRFPQTIGFAGPPA